ncbi:MAG: hypothetical protein M4D80_36250 [Myxococcota bacterium]|nr:hypothetical protein [Deltaproteobacteria bacterium]MDQ3340642.1 hypothetical protein [Myxococcota bacterium]
MRAHPLCALILVCACTDTTNQTDRDLAADLAAEEGDVDSDECKLEGSAIGVEKTVIQLGSKAVRVHDWVAKTGSHGEYVGFSLTLGGDTVAYKVKASGEVYPSSTLTWIHPNGPDGGSKSPGISNIDFCDDCDNPDGCEGGGGEPPPPPPSEPVLN